MTQSKVTAPQFFSVLYLSVLGSMFMYISSAQTAISTVQALFRPFVLAVFNVAVAVPIYFLCKKNCFNAGFDLCEKKRCFKSVAVFYGVVYFVDALMTVGRFDLFASSELFPGTEMTYFIIGLVVVCVSLSFCGFGALGRASTIFTFVVIAATLFASVTLSKEVDFLNFTPFFETGTGKFFDDSLLLCIQMSEIGTIVIFFPQISGKIKKHYVTWSFLSAVSFSFVLFFVVGTLGTFADTQLFPTYSAVSLAKFGLFERLDALETAIWVLCVVTKLTFYILAVVKCVCYAFPKFSERNAAVAVGIALSAVLVFISGNIMNFRFVSYTPLVAGLYFTAVVVLPSVLLIKNLLERRRKNETVT